MSFSDLVTKVFGGDIHEPKPAGEVSAVGTVTNGPEQPNKKGVHIRVVIDESGSMQGVQAAAINGFNAFLETQKRVDDGSVISIWKFNNCSDKTPMITHRSSLNLAEPLNGMTYSPKGQTALNDAIGDAIMEDPNENNVILAILTDGQENQSYRYGQHHIRKMIQDKQKDGWEVLFLSASSLTGQQESTMYGVGLDKVVKFAPSNAGLGEAYGALNSSSTSYRASR